MSAPTGSSWKRSCRSSAIVVKSDALIALEGAVGTGDGAIACSAPAAPTWRARDGETRAVGGWGFMVGDQGSGARIGRDLLEETLLAYDGIREASDLTRAVLAVFRNEPRDVVEFTTTAKPGDFGGFAPMVFEHAAKGDAVAEKILDSAPSASSRRRCSVLDLRPGDPLCLLGGLAELYAPRLLGALPRAAASAAAGRAGRRRADGGAPVRDRRRQRPMAEAAEDIFAALKASAGNGAPLYLQLKKSIEDAVRRGVIGPGDALPSERDIAVKADMSRVTVRKAVQDLVRGGILVQRHGSGTFVAPRVERVEQSLSLLTSFTEDMARRGMAVRSEWLDRGIYPPSPEEMMVLGLSSKEMVARVSRLRIANDTPLAIERASLSSSVLPDPEAVGASLYAALEKTGNRPVRAMQRISAANLGEADARLLAIPAGSAGLNIERISYLATGKVIEFTRSIYRGDTYDFVAELRLTRSERSRGRHELRPICGARSPKSPRRRARLLDQAGGALAEAGAEIRSARSALPRPRWRAARRTMPRPS